jgi:hypothetical protein
MINLPIDDKQLNEWQIAVDSPVMGEVLNAMEDMKNSGDVKCLSILEQAGQNIDPMFKEMKFIKLEDDPINFFEFKNECIKELIGKEPVNINGDLTNKHVFISYNHNDKAIGTKIALDLQSKEIEVYMDHWEMGVGDSILEKIEEGIDNSSFLIVLLSSNSVESEWVRTELQYAFNKEQQMDRKFIIPIVLDDCNLPDSVAGRKYINIINNSDYKEGIQYILNAIRCYKPFSQLVTTLISNIHYLSPYNEKASREGRRILIDLAQYREMDIEENQKWILWELFHNLLDEYKCRIKIGLESAYGSTEDQNISFIVSDYWNQTSSSISLTKEQFNKGLWKGEIDLFKGSRLTAKDMEWLGSKGRLTFQNDYNPNTAINPYPDTCSLKMSPIIDILNPILSQYNISSQNSFLFDLQNVIFSQFNRKKVTLIVGSGTDDLCYAFSGFHNIEHSPPGNGWAIFELYDPFFRSLKYTAVCPNHLNISFEGDIDLFSNEGEVILGPE